VGRVRKGRDLAETRSHLEDQLEGRCRYDEMGNLSRGLRRWRMGIVGAGEDRCTDLEEDRCRVREARHGQSPHRHEVGWVQRVRRGLYWGDCVRIWAALLWTDQPEETWRVIQSSLEPGQSGAEKDTCHFYDWVQMESDDEIQSSSIRSGALLVRSCVEGMPGVLCTTSRSLNGFGGRLSLRPLADLLSVL
jgi:hypothetical protein